MKIATLNLKDFRSYEQADIAFSQPLTIIRALNGKGKTSLQQAIELALTKSTDGVDPRGAGANNKIRNGASKAEIGVLLDTAKGPISVKARYGPGKTGRQAKIEPPEFERYMDSNKERLSCVLNTRYFTGLNQKEQSAVLAGLVLPTAYDFDVPMMNLSLKHLGLFDIQQRPVALIDQIYEAAYSARKTAKATLAGIYVPREPSKPEHTSERVQKELADLRKKASAETKNLKGGGSTAVGRAEADLDAASKALQKARADVETAIEARTSMAFKPMASDALKKHQKIAAGRAIFNSLQAKAEALNAEIHAQRDAQDIYKGLLAEPVCPTCTQAITKAFIDAKVKEHYDLEQDAIEAQRGLLKEQQALGDIDGAEKAIAANSQGDEAWRDKLNDIQVAEEDVRVANQSVEAAVVALEAAKASATAPPDTTALDALNEQIRQWEALLGPATTYESTLATIEREMKRYDEQKATVADLETLCTYFGKDGIKATLIAENIEAFSATVNSVLQSWGFVAEFSFDPYEFWVTGENGKLPLSELSGGETFMFCAALQCAIAIHGKIKTVVIDQADTLVDAARTKLFRCVKGLLDAGHLAQTIILEASGNFEVTAKAGVGYYRVFDGKVEAL